MQVRPDDTNHCLNRLRNIRCKFPKNVILSYLNINSVRNKLNDIYTLVGNSVDILTIAETKLDRTFPEIQFCLPTFKTPSYDAQKEIQWVSKIGIHAT